MKPGIQKVTLEKLFRWMSKNILLVITFSGVSLGVIVGILLRPYELSTSTIGYIAYPGELFMRLLKLMILPLIIASLITGEYQMSDIAHSHVCTGCFNAPPFKKQLREPNSWHTPVQQMRTHYYTERLFLLPNVSQTTEPPYCSFPEVVTFLLSAVRCLSFIFWPLTTKKKTISRPPYCPSLSLPRDRHNRKPTKDGLRTSFIVKRERERVCNPP